MLTLEDTASPYGQAQPRLNPQFEYDVSQRIHLQSLGDRLKRKFAWVILQSTDTRPRCRRAEPGPKLLSVMATLIRTRGYGSIECQIAARNLSLYT